MTHQLKATIQQRALVTPQCTLISRTPSGEVYLVSNGTDAHITKIFRTGTSEAKLGEMLVGKPGVIQQLGCRIDGDTTIVTLEYYPNGDLFNIIQNEPFEEKQALDVCLQIAIGLFSVHSVGFYHRDISLENILQSEENKYVLADFGLAASVDDEKGLQKCVGKPTYIAPEIVEKSPYTAKSDIYSLGACLFMMITGFAPFKVASKSDDAYEVFAEYGMKTLLKVYQIASISDATVELLGNMMNPNPEDRISLADLLDRLKK